jgi:hypothetical protein
MYISGKTHIIANEMKTYETRTVSNALRNMVAVQNLKGEIIQLILSRKGGGGMHLVSATPTKLLIEFL